MLAFGRTRLSRCRSSSSMIIADSAGWIAELGDQGGSGGAVMNEDRLRSPQHSNIRAMLRVGGPAILGLGLIFTLVGFGSFFAALGSFEPPRYFWCAFIGLPLMFIGGALCMFGFLGALQRYVAGESAPVAKDVFNYMGENAQPGIKAVAKAVAGGVIEAQREQHPRPGGPS
jgi:hypothetical protein